MAEPRTPFEDALTGENPILGENAALIHQLAMMRGNGKVTATLLLETKSRLEQYEKGNYSTLSDAMELDLSEFDDAVRQKRDQAQARREVEANRQRRVLTGYQTRSQADEQMSPEDIVGPTQPVEEVDFEKQEQAQYEREVAAGQREEEIDEGFEGRWGWKDIVSYPFRTGVGLLTGDKKPSEVFEEVFPGETDYGVPEKDEYDPVALRKLGLENLAEEVENTLRTRKDLVGYAMLPDLDGERRLRNILKLPTTKAFGQFVKDPDVQKELMIDARMSAMARRRGFESYLDMPDEEFNRMRAVAEYEGNRDYARIWGTHKRLGRMAVDVDPKRTVRSFQQGIIEGAWTGDDTWRQRFMKLAVGGPISEGVRWAVPAFEYGLKRLMGETPEESSKDAMETYRTIGEALAPIYATLTPGGTGKDFQFGDPVIGQKSEGWLGWISRAGVYSPAYALLDELDLKHDGDITKAWEVWSSPEYLERIYSGADVVELHNEFNEAISEATGGSGFMSGVLSFGALASILFGEPDLLSVATFGAGKLVTGVADIADVTRMSMLAQRRIYIRAIEKMESAGTPEEFNKAVKEVIAELSRDQDQDLARMILNDANAAVASEIAARGGRLQTTDGAGPTARSFWDDLENMLKMGEDVFTKKDFARAKAERLETEAYVRMRRKADKVAAAEDKLDDTMLRQGAHILEMATDDLLDSARDMFAFARMTPHGGVTARHGDGKAAAREAFDVFAKEFGAEAAVASTIALAKAIREVEKYNDRIRPIKQMLDELLENMRRVGPDSGNYKVYKNHYDKLNAEYIRLLGERRAAAGRFSAALTPKAIHTSIRGFNKRLASHRGLLDFFERAVKRAGGPDIVASAGPAGRKMMAEIKKASAQIERVRNALNVAKKSLEAAEKLLAKRAARTVKATDAAKDAERSLHALSQADLLFGKVLRTRLAQVEKMISMYDKEGIKFRPLDLDSTIASKSVGRPFAEVRADMVARYGEDAVRYAERMIPDVLSGSGTVGKLDENRILHLEQAMHATRESRRLDDVDEVARMIRSLRGGPAFIGGGLKTHHHLRRLMAIAGYIERTAGSISSRGFAGMPDFMQDLVRKTLHTIGYGDNALNKIASKAFRDAEAEGKANGLTGDALMDFIMDEVSEKLRLFINTHTSFEVNGIIEPFNKGLKPVSEQAFNYLQMLARAEGARRGSEVKPGSVWMNDPSVQSIARAFIPSGALGADTAGAGARRLYDMVLSGKITNGSELFDGVFAEMRRIAHRFERRVDAERVALAFISRGFVAAAAYNEWVYNLHRAVGVNISAKAANALNFLTSARNLNTAGFTSAGTELLEGLEELAKIGPMYGTTIHKQVATGLKGIAAGIKSNNDLIKLAEVDGHMVYIPRQLKEAMDAVPNRIAKEIEEYNSVFTFTGNPAWYWFKRVTSFWKMSKVNGVFIPRWAFGTTSLFGNFTQLLMSLGWGTAARITLQNWHNYMPFIGPWLQGKFLEAGKKTYTGAFLSPGMTRLMSGDDTMLIPTKEGSMRASQFMREALENGAQDSIVTDAITETLHRTRSVRGRFPWLADMIAHRRATPWAEAYARQIERAEFQMRVQIYYEARTGKLTGEKLSRQDATKIMLESMYDWKLGMTKWESETVARTAAFYSYTRNMLRQMGSLFAEAFAEPGAKYIPKALTGDTKLARFKQYNRLHQLTPELVMWEDPDSIVDDDEQLDAYLRRLFPFWAQARMVLTGRQVPPERVLGYDMQGRQVTYEHLVMVSTTASEMFNLLHMISNLTWASYIESAEAIGIETGLAADWRTAFKDVVDWTAGQAHPFIEEPLTAAVREVLDVEPDPESRRGEIVDRDIAYALKTMGFDKMGYLSVYTDENGTMRHSADAIVFPIAVSVIETFLPALEESMNLLTTIGNPAMKHSYIRGFLEAFSGHIGLYRWYGSNPERTEFFDVIKRENNMIDARKRAEVEAGRR